MDSKRFWGKKGCFLSKPQWDFGRKVPKWIQSGFGVKTGGFGPGDDVIWGEGGGVLGENLLDLGKIRSILGSCQ